MTTALSDSYDLVIFDLDGVVYLDRDPIPGAVNAINRLTKAGPPVAYVTNNASRLAGDVAALLRDLGVNAAEDDVVTSAHESASVLATRLPVGAPVLVVGGVALRTEITAVGLQPVSDASGSPAAVVQGYARDIGWVHLAEACVAVRAGAWWVATNADRTLPSPRGPLPGNGSLVAALATALGRGPDLIVGKPSPDLFTTAARRVGARHPLVVGDRIDTDVAGAVRTGFDAMLVLTGVSTPADVIAAPDGSRPMWIAPDLGALANGDLAARVPAVSTPGTPVASGGWTVRRTGAGLELAGEGRDVAALAGLAAAAWQADDLPSVTPTGDAAAATLDRLGLARSRG
ncbi:MAG TPA: HAD-IIA family hydrolase [Micromonosporaceae bacterium]|nr:HAD-IIA family hydrolase [Micromonosporaceae bacterium]